jgi:hypothetical protein
MKNFYSLILMMVSISANGQFAIINNENGYVDVREETNLNSKVLGRLFNEDIFWCEEGHMTNQNSKWTTVFQNVFMDKTDQYKRDYYIKEFGRLKNEHFICSGNILKSDLVLLNNLQDIELQKIYLTTIESKIKDNKAYFFNDSIKFNFVIGSFNPAEHQIDKYLDSRKVEYVNKIDGNPAIRGVFANMPSIDIKNIILTINSDSIKIPKKDYWDLFSPNIWNLCLKVDKRGLIYIYLFNNSDGAGWYSAVWIIKGHKYLNRYVDSPG